MKLRQKKLYQNSIYVLKLRGFVKNVLITNGNKEKDKWRPKIKVNKKRQLKVMENKQKCVTEAKIRSKMKKDQNKLFKQKQHIQLIKDQNQGRLEMINGFDQPIKKDKIFEERKEILYNLIQKCQKVYRETQPSKYFSKNIYNKINENDQGFNLTQDQKKSLQSNLIYSILKYLQWNKIVTFLKKNRTKVKILKISTFEKHVLKRKLFLKQQAVQKLQVTSQMLQKALFKLQYTIDIYQNICQKKIYIKLYQQNIQLFKQKMIICIYKIIQFKELLKKYYEQNYKQLTKNDPIEDILHQISKLPKKCTKDQNKDIFNNLMSTNFYENEQFIQYSNLPPIPLTYNLQQDDFFSQQLQSKPEYKTQEQKNENKIQLSNQDEIFIEDIDQCQNTYNQGVLKLHTQN